MTELLPHYERDAILWRSSLPGTSKLMLLAINSFMANSDTCWPGYEKLAQMCGVGKRTAIKLVDELEQVGALLVTRTSKRAKGTNKQPSNRYKIRFDAIPKIEQGAISALRHRVQKFPLQGADFSQDRVQKFPLQGAESAPELSIELSSKNYQENYPPIVPQATEQPGGAEVALLRTAEHETSGDGLGAIQASPVKRLEAVGECECSAAAPRPENFERTAYGSAPSPIMAHYGMSYMVAGRQGPNLKFEPQLVRGMRKHGQDWPGSHALTTDGRAIAHIRKLLSNLTKPQEFEAAWARLELAWEEGAETAPAQSQRLSQAEELRQRFAYYNQGAA